MRLAIAVLSIGAFALAALPGCSKEKTGSAAPEQTGTTATAAAPQETPGSQVFTASLKGSEEIPGPGDEDGSGSAQITIDEGKGELCYEITVQNIEPATLAHVHVGPAGQAGAVAVTLEAPTSGSSKGCANVEPTLLQEIVGNPAGYYVNVHNSAFPDGAARGQLAQ